MKNFETLTRDEKLKYFRYDIHVAVLNITQIKRNIERTRPYKNALYNNIETIKNSLEQLKQLNHFTFSIIDDLDLTTKDRWIKKEIGELLDRFNLYISDYTMYKRLEQEI